MASSAASSRQTTHATVETSDPPLWAPADRLGQLVGERLHGRSRAGVIACAGVVVAGYVSVVIALTAIGLVLTHVLASGPIGHADAHVNHWLANHRTAGLNRLTFFLSRSADTLGAIGIAVVIAIGFALKRYWRAIRVLFLGLSLELLAFLAINGAVGRPRPRVPRLGGTPSTSSFPSGHTAATVVIYLTLALVVSSTARNQAARVVAWLGAVVMPLAVAFARVYRGMHAPLDTAAGVLMGCAAVLIAIAAFRALTAAQSETPVRRAGQKRSNKLKAVA